MTVHDRKLVAAGVVSLAAVAAVALGQLHIVAEPPWLRRMNEFEHLVLHATFVLAGMIAGSIALAVLLWSAARWSPALRRTIAADPKVDSGVRPHHLALIALCLLIVTVTLLAAQHGGLPEPAWLARVTPFQHFLVHVTYILSGALIALSALLAWGRSLLGLLGREPSTTNSSGTEPSRLSAGGTGVHRAARG